MAAELAVKRDGAVDGSGRLERLGGRGRIVELLQVKRGRVVVQPAALKGLGRHAIVVEQDAVNVRRPTEIPLAPWPASAALRYSRARRRTSAGLGGKHGSRFAACRAGSTGRAGYRRPGSRADRGPWSERPARSGPVIGMARRRASAGSPSRNSRTSFLSKAE